MASFFGGGSIFGSSIDSSEITDGSIVNADISASAAIASSKISGLGTIASQDSNNVNITGGAVTGITDLVVADGGTGVSSVTAYSVICAGTTSTGAFQPLAALGASGTVLTSNGAGALPSFQAAGGGTFVKAVRSSTNTSGSTATTIPFDDTIPQNTEGAQVLTVSITPSNTNNVLVIEYSLYGTMIQNSGVTDRMISALFQDSTANAIYAQLDWTGKSESASSVFGGNVYGRYYMTAGTTSSTTFKLRVGCGTNTYYWLSSAGTNLFSTSDLATLTVKEYTA